MADTYRTRHKISGVIDENTPQHILDAFSDVLEVVGPDAKPYLPEMHRAALPAEYTKDQLEVARVAGFTNPAAFENAVEDAKVAKREAEATAAADAETAKASAKTAPKNQDKS